MRSLFRALIVVALAVTAAVDVATAQPSLTYSGLFPLQGKIAAYNADQKKLEFFEVKSGAFTTTSSLPVAGNVWAATDLPDGYVFSTGYGRGDLSAPMKVFLVKKSGKPELIFERNGERTQTAQLKWSDGKLWITFFASKFQTKTGYLSPSDAGAWTFTEMVEQRLGDAVDFSSGKIVIGRPYGDVQGQDGDLAIFSGSEKIELPSYRGVRAVSFFGSGEWPDLFTGDGWHQNYGQFAQARLNLLRRNPASGRYSMELIHHDSAQYGYSKIIPFKLGEKLFVAAIGNKELDVFGPADEWKKTTIYTRSNELSIFDVALASSSGSAVTFAVLDNGVKAVSFP